MRVSFWLLRVGGLALLCSTQSIIRAHPVQPSCKCQVLSTIDYCGSWARGAQVHLVNHATRIRARMKNVVAMVKGTRSNRSPLVVMTPRSAWWNCASERGGGIVCWLEVLRALVAFPPAADVIFTANSGHELGHIGMLDFMSRRPMLATTATWLHFGANIGARNAKHSLYSAHEELSGLGQAEMTRVGHAPDMVFPTNVPANGESREVHKVGGRYITLVGSNPLFVRIVDPLFHEIAERNNRNLSGEDVIDGSWLLFERGCLRLVDDGKHMATEIVPSVARRPKRTGHWLGSSVRWIAP